MSIGFKTEITDKGSTIEAGTVVPEIDRRTRQQRLEELDDDFEYTKGGDLTRR